MAVTCRRPRPLGGTLVACAVALVVVIGTGKPALASAVRLGGRGATTLVRADRQDPAASMRPTAAFAKYCYARRQVSACNAAALADIDLARHDEHLAELVLPGDFATRGVPAQLATIVDLERTARHLPSMPRQRPLDARARAGAEAGVDPTGPSDQTWGANLSTGYATPLAADFGWMYDDGVGSPNAACTSAGQAACWGHRHNILAPWAGTQGAGRNINSHGAVVLTQLFVKDH